MYTEKSSNKSNDDYTFCLNIQRAIFVLFDCHTKAVTDCDVDATARSGWDCVVGQTVWKLHVMTRKTHLVGLSRRA